MNIFIFSSITTLLFLFFYLYNLSIKNKIFNLNNNILNIAQRNIIIFSYSINIIILVDLFLIFYHAYS
jgi:hypothetical protein